MAPYPKTNPPPSTTVAWRKGYAKGLKRAWPDHAPPYPPTYQVRDLMMATQELRNAVDTMLATWDPDDEWAKTLGPLIDTADIAIAQIGAWLKTVPEDFCLPEGKSRE